MENASKALLIAGSVLIVILLIAMGVKVFNSTQGTTDQVEGTMQSTEVAMFNNKFTQYVGKNKTAAQVKSLLNLIQANNATGKHKVEVKVAFTKLERVIENQSYTVIIYEYDENGYIKTIDIKGWFWADDMEGRVKN